MRFLLPLLFLVYISPLTAQVETWSGYSITCTTQDTAAGAYQSAPLEFLNGSVVLESKFDLRFSGDVPGVAEASMTFAAGIWGSYLQSEVPIRVDIQWEDRMDDRLLASAGPGTLYRDFPGGEPNTWYAVALAEAIVGQSLNDDEDADINVIVNSEANWYYGIDGRTPRNRIDLATVFLHELGHGLGFLSSIDSTSETELSIGFDDRNIIYDLFLETPTGLPLADRDFFGSPSPELLAAVIDDFVFAGEEARDRNGDADVPLFAPSTFDIGSSVSHLDESAYRAGSINALMTPFVAAGEAVHDPGPVTLGLFFDLGWPLIFDLTSTKEIVADRVAVFPNPATNYFIIPLVEVSKPELAVLYSSDGREVRRMALQKSPNAEFSVGGLVPGVYNLVVMGERRYSSRVVVR